MQTNGSNSLDTREMDPIVLLRGRVTTRSKTRASHDPKGVESLTPYVIIDTSCHDVMCSRLHGTSMGIAFSLLQGKGMHAQDHHRGLSAGGYSYGLKGANTGVGPNGVHHSWVMDTLCYVIASLYTRRDNGHAGAQTHCRERPSIGLYAVVCYSAP